MDNRGKRVMVHYVGTLDDGTVFDSSRDRGEPIVFVCGAGKMIPGFDRAVEDMEIYETRDVHIEPEDAYGPEGSGHPLAGKALNFKITLLAVER